jgi:hypothetical protein
MRPAVRLSSIQDQDHVDKKAIARAMPKDIITSIKKLKKNIKIMLDMIMIIMINSK